MNPLQQSGDVESNPGPPKVAKVTTKSAKAMVHLNGHGDQNGHEEVVVDQDGVRSVLEKQAELINKQSMTSVGGPLPGMWPSQMEQSRIPRVNSARSMARIDIQYMCSRI